MCVRFQVRGLCQPRVRLARFLTTKVILPIKVRIRFHPLFFSLLRVKPQSGWLAQVVECNVFQPLSQSMSSDGQVRRVFFALNTNCRCFSCQSFLSAVIMSISHQRYTLKDRGICVYYPFNWAQTSESEDGWISISDYCLRATELKRRGTEHIPLGKMMGNCLRTRVDFLKRPSPNKTIGV